MGEVFFTLLFFLLLGIAIGAGCMYFYFKKCRLNLDDLELEEKISEDQIEASNLKITPSTMAITFANDDGATAQIITLEKGDEIVVKTNNDILVVDLYASDDTYDDE